MTQSGMSESDGLSITPLASGSRGNATVVSGRGTRLLIDAGLPEKELRARMSASGIEPDSIDWVVPTHRHSDHVSGVADFVRSTRARILAMRATARVLGSEVRKRVVEARPDKLFELTPRREEHGLCVWLHEVPHDAPQTVTLRVSCGGVRYGHLTDCGHVREDLPAFLSDCDGLLIEFNHDRDQLFGGKDPDYLKRRISSPTGHLPNDEAATLLGKVCSDRLQHVWLAHLSQRNNTPDSALAAARRAVEHRTDLPITVLEQDRPAPTVRLGAVAEAG